MSRDAARLDSEESETIHGLRSHEPQTLQEFLNFEKELENERLKSLKKMSECINEIQGRLSSIKNEVRGDFTMELRDADYYRVSMFQLEGKITNLHQAIREELHILMKEETELCNELHSVSRRLEDWSKPYTTKPIKTVASGYKIIDSTEEDATSQFQKFLACYGGHAGGWEEQDHALFLRERRKFHGRPKFLSVVHNLLPDISEDEILAHDNWYQKYEKLKELQKEAIRKWRAKKHTDLTNKASSQDEQEKTDERPRSYVRQRDITERIKEWKRQQIIKKAEEEERLREEQQRQHEERLRKREIQKAKKSAIENFKAEKLSRQHADLLSQQMKELQALEDRAKKNALLKAFREQDQQFMEKKKLQRLQNQLKEKQREERFQHVKVPVEVTVERDPQRVLQPTRVWSNHCAPDDSNLPSNSILNLHTIPHLGIPNWRRGLHTDNNI